MPDFDLSDHIHHLALPRPSGRRELETLVASYLTVPLDQSRPLWDLYVVDDYYGGTALYFRMHHCIADGIALTRVLLSLTDGGEAWAGLADDTDEGQPRHLQRTGVDRAARDGHDRDTPQARPRPRFRRGQ